MPCRTVDEYVDVVRHQAFGGRSQVDLAVIRVAWVCTDVGPDDAMPVAESIDDGAAEIARGAGDEDGAQMISR